MEQSLLFIVKMVLIIMTGPSGQDVKPSRIQRDTYPEKAAIYAHFDLSELRKQILKDPALKTAIYGQEDGKKAFDATVTQLCKKIDVKPDVLMTIIGSARGVGFWMDAKPKPKKIPKGLVVVDFGEETIGLIPLMKIHAKMMRMTYVPIEEEGLTIHTFQVKGEDVIIHTVVRDGMLAIALDPASVRSFAKAKKVVPKKRVGNNFLTIETTGSDIVDMIHAAVHGREHKEANLIIGLFDLRSYKTITGSIAMDKVSVAFDLNPNGAAARILKPGKNNRLAKAFPEKDSAGYFISLEDPLELWRFIKGQLSMHLGKEFQFVESILGDMKREIGIDLEADLLPTLEGFFQFVPVESIAGFGDVGTVFAFKFKSAKLADEQIVRFMTAPKISDKFMKAQLKGNQVYREKDLKDSPIIARKGTSIMLAGEMGGKEDPEPIGLIGIDALNRMNKETENVSAIAGARAELDQFFGRDMPELTLSLTRKENLLEASFTTTFTPYAIWLLSGKPLFEHEVPRNKDRLMRIYGMLKNHADENGDEYPKDRWRIRHSYRLFQGWVNPKTGNVRSFNYVGGIGKNTPNKAKVFLLYEPQSHNDERTVIYLDGRVKTVKEKEFTIQFKKQNDLKNGLICDLPEAERKKVRELCKQLGDENFKVRRTARKALEAMGGSILPILREFETHEDPELKMNVKKLIDKYLPKDGKTRVLPHGAMKSPVIRKSA